MYFIINEENNIDNIMNPRFKHFFEYLSNPSNFKYLSENDINNILYIIPDLKKQENLIDIFKYMRENKVHYKTYETIQNTIRIFL